MHQALQLLQVTLTEGLLEQTLCCPRVRMGHGNRADISDESDDLEPLSTVAHRSASKATIVCLPFGGGSKKRPVKSGTCRLMLDRSSGRFPEKAIQGSTRAKIEDNQSTASRSGGNNPSFRERWCKGLYGASARVVFQTILIYRMLLGELRMNKLVCCACGSQDILSL